jgi:hypothetical protein
LNTKTCSCCQRTLPITSFSKNKKMADGYAFYCKQCYAKKTNKSRGYKDSTNKDYKVKLNFTEIKVEEGKLFKTPKDFIAFKRNRLLKQTGDL